MEIPVVKTGGKKVYLYQLEQTGELTRWEEIFRSLRPNHFYVIWSNWNKRVRDFVAYVKVAQKHEFDKTNTTRTNKYTILKRWYDSAVKGKIDEEGWEWYISDPSTMTDANLAARAAFEALSPAEREVMARGSYHSTRTHVDGSIINEQTGEVSKPDVEESLLTKVMKWACETHHGIEHCIRWKMAANGIRHNTFPGSGQMSSDAALEYSKKFMHSRWYPVYEAILKREIADMESAGFGQQDIKKKDLDEAHMIFLIEEATGQRNWAEVARLSKLMEGQK